MESICHYDHQAQRPTTSSETPLHSQPTYTWLILDSRPYTSSPIALEIGFKVYYVAQDLLQSPAWIASCNHWSKTIRLPDIDEDTGHVLAHYLHTGAYQTLGNIVASPSEDPHEFKRAVMAYAAAKKYELRGLEKLAEDKIEHFGNQMNIIQIAEAIKEDFSKIPNDAAWFHDYLNQKASAGFEDYNTSLEMDSLFDCIENIALMRFLAKCVLGIYNDESTRKLLTEQEAVSGIAEDFVPETQVTPMEEPAEADIMGTAETAPIEEAPTQDAIAQESIVDPFSSLSKFHAKKLQIKMQKQKKHEEQMRREEEATLSAKSDVQLEEEKDNVWDDAIPSQPHEELAAELSPIEPTNGDTHEEAGHDCFATTSKVYKKGPENTSLPSISIAEVEPDKRKSENGDAVSEKRPDAGLTPVPYVTPTQDPDIPEVLLEKREDVKNRQFLVIPEEKESARTPVPVEAIHEMTLAPIQKSHEDDVSGMTLPRSKKKSKKMKKGLKSAKLGILQPPSESTASFDPASEALAVQAAENIPAEEKYTVPTEALGSDVSNGQPCLSVETENETCPLLREHLLDGEQWKFCQLCQAYVRNAAVRRLNER